MRNDAAIAQIVAYLLGGDLERLLVDIAVEYYVDDLVAAGQLLDNGLLYLGWKGVDAVDFVLDLVEERGHIDVPFEFNADHADTFCGSRADPAHALEATHPLFDAFADGFLDLARGRTEIGHLDLHLVQ